MASASTSSISLGCLTQLRHQSRNGIHAHVTCENLCQGIWKLTCHCVGGALDCLLHSLHQILMPFVDKSVLCPPLPGDDAEEGHPKAADIVLDSCSVGGPNLCTSEVTDLRLHHLARRRHLQQNILRFHIAMLHIIGMHGCQGVRNLLQCSQCRLQGQLSLVCKLLQCATLEKLLHHADVVRHWACVLQFIRDDGNCALLCKHPHRLISVHDVGHFCRTQQLGDVPFLHACACLRHPNELQRDAAAIRLLLGLEDPAGSAFGDVALDLHHVFRTFRCAQILLEVLHLPQSRTIVVSHEGEVICLNGVVYKLLLIHVSNARRPAEASSCSRCCSRRSQSRRCWCWCWSRLAAGRRRHQLHLCAAHLLWLLLCGRLVLSCAFCKLLLLLLILLAVSSHCIRNGLLGFLPLTLLEPPHLLQALCPTKITPV
mmetsp:Transcript_14741/g.34762  ORF Transcript_14741/g.34762 Transcript_14741/m.34762 type:complete len:428 (+) Transcript_14741:89-1372(+)